MTQGTLVDECCGWPLQGAEPPDVPDPYLAITSGSRFSSSPVAATNRVRQRRRRADILAGARWLLAQEGFDKVAVRDVAARSGVSVQTVYNLVGDRSAVLGEAVVEYIMAMGRFARTRANYPNVLLALSDTYWLCSACNPTYIRTATLTYFPPGRPLYDRIRRCGTHLAEDALKEMRTMGQLRETICPAMLAPQIASLGAITMLNGLRDRSSIGELRRAMVNGCALLLMSAVREAEAERIELWLESYELPSQSARSAA